MGVSDRQQTIGRVEWGEKGFVRMAILHADGHWETPHQPELAATLDDRHGDDFRSMGPADGFPGVPQLRAVAALFDGKVFLEPNNDPPGLLY